MDTAKNRIKKAFADLLSKKDLSEISVTDICRQARVSRVTFYLWYKGKETLLNDMFQDILNEGVPYFEKLREAWGKDSLQAAFRALLETIFYLANRYHESVSHLFPQTGQEDQILYSHFSSLALKQVKDLTSEYSAQIMEPLTISEVTCFLAGGLSSLIREDLKEGLDPESVHSHASALLDRFLSSGLLSAT